MEGGSMVTIITHDGKVYTDPGQIEVPRNETTEMFYQLLESHLLKQKGKSDE